MGTFDISRMRMLNRQYPHGSCIPKSIRYRSKLNTEIPLARGTWYIILLVLFIVGTVVRPHPLFGCVIAAVDVEVSHP